MKKETESIKFPVITFKKLETPYEDDGRKDYIMVVNIKKIPKELDSWLDVNPRHQKVSSSVSKDIKETLETSPENFYFKNRGLTVLANKILYDNKNNEVILKMEDKSLHGLLDGGHTYRIIMNHLNENPDFTDKSFIKIEVLEGFKDRGETIDLVEARNTSAQVKNVSILELNDYFQPIKTALGLQTYKNDISYKEYELYEDGSKKKDIPVQDIISYLICFDPEYDWNIHPIFAYSSKTATLDYYEKNVKKLEKCVSLLPIILKLWDIIQLEYSSLYKGKLANYQGVKKKNSKLRYAEDVCEYKIPRGYIYPILAAFRDLIVCKKDECDFSTDPIKLFHKLKETLFKRVLETAKDMENPNKLGKERLLWQACADIVHYNK